MDKSSISNGGKPVNITIEHMAIYNEFSRWKVVIFHSYVSLPEGNAWHGSVNKSDDF